MQLLGRTVVISLPWHQRACLLQLYLNLPGTRSGVFFICFRILLKNLFIVFNVQHLHAPDCEDGVRHLLPFGDLACLFGRIAWLQDGPLLREVSGHCHACMEMLARFADDPPGVLE